jgi:hypothetical protein
MQFQSFLELLQSFLEPLIRFSSRFLAKDSSCLLLAPLRSDAPELLGLVPRFDADSEGVMDTFDEVSSLRSQVRRLARKASSSGLVPASD